MPGINAIAWQILGGYHVSGRNHLWQTVHLYVMTGAATTHVGILKFSSKERHVFGLQIEVGQKVVVDLLHHVGPFGISTVRAALMEQDTLDDA